jgi:hypothetical protein
MATPGFLVLGVLLIVLLRGHDGAEGFTISGIVFTVLAVVGGLVVGGCYGCKYSARRRLENELVDASRGPVLNQALLQESF